MTSALYTLDVHPRSDSMELTDAVLITLPICSNSNWVNLQEHCFVLKKVKTFYNKMSKQRMFRDLTCITQ